MRPGWTRDDIYRICERGYSLHQQGRYREAAVIFDGLIAVDPDNDYCRDALAAALLALGEAQRAVEQLDTVLAHDSGHLAAAPGASKLTSRWTTSLPPGQILKF